MKTRSTWTEGERTQVATIENGSGVVLTAFLFDATLSDPETYNCYKAGDSNRDFHIWLAEDKTGAKGQKFNVVEMTPRIRPDHSGWKRAAIKQPRHPSKAGRSWDSSLHPRLRQKPFGKKEA